MAADLALTAALLLTVQVLLVVGVRVVLPGINVYAAIVAVSLVTAPGAFAAGPYLLGGLSAAGRWFLALLHLTLGGFFFHFMTLPDRSVTLRILVELLRTPG